MFGYPETPEKRWMQGWKHILGTPTRGDGISPIYFRQKSIGDG